MSKNEHHARPSSAYVETIAGLSAGTASTLAVHPLDVIKTRLQIHRTTSSVPTNSITILRSLLQNPHPIQSLYRGLTPNLLGNASSWAIFFYVKSLLETQLRVFHSRSSASRSPSKTPSSSPILRNASRQQDTPALSPLDYFLASGASGLLITIATNPIWVLKTRMLSTDAGAHGAYPSMIAGARDVWNTDGFRGFYRGLAISCVGVSHGAVQFAVYEPLKDAWFRYSGRRREGGDGRGGRRGREEKLGNQATLVISGAAKVVAGTVTYPYQVVRSRLQTYDSEARFGRGIGGVVGKVWREEGWRGFYKGLGPNVVRVLPATWVTFLVYENTRFYLSR